MEKKWHNRGEGWYVVQILDSYGNIHKPQPMFSYDGFEAEFVYMPYCDEIWQILYEN